MGMFLEEPPDRRRERPQVDRMAVASLVVAASGFLNVVGFLAGPVLGAVALRRVRATGARGRRLAIAAIALSCGVLVVAGLALAAVLLSAYAGLPAPPG